MSKFVQKYGNNMFFRDTAWKRVQRCHEAHENITVFNYHSGCSCCHGGGYGDFGWGGSFLQNFGFGLGFGLLSGLLGGFMNRFSFNINPWTSMSCWGSAGFGAMPNFFGIPTNNFDFGLGTTPTKPSKEIDVIGDPDAKKPAQVKENSAVSTNDNEPVTTDAVATKVDGDYSEIPELTTDDKDTLKSLGVKIINLPYTTYRYGLSLPKDMTAKNLEKLQAISEKYDIPVAMANNAQAGNDKWIAGFINAEDIDKNIESGELSYSINCANVGAYGYAYSVYRPNSNGNYTITCSAPGTTLNKDQRQAVSGGCEYEYNNGILCRNEEPENVKSKTS